MSGNFTPSALIQNYSRNTTTTTTIPKHHGSSNGNPAATPLRAKRGLSVSAQWPINPIVIASKPNQTPGFSPNFTLTLLRTPKLPPTFASFIVPLNTNKLDLRDYLYHCYGVRVLGVRSFVQQQKLRQDKPGAIRPSPRQWYRPRSIKKMLVELERPFAWPEEPEDFDRYVVLDFVSCGEALLGCRINPERVWLANGFAQVGPEDV
jgi:large subunit ribosomal protein L23